MHSGFNLTVLALLVTMDASSVFGVALVEYPGHPATYGDHSFAATWDGVGPVTMVFQSDENVLHADGQGQSQRTARNTLNFTAPSAANHPQNYDDLYLVNLYGSRLPLLQHMAANGTSTLRYEFTTVPSSGLDLFVTDLDTSDAVSIRAAGPGNVLHDMTSWSLAAEGDLSLFKDTGTDFSAVVAPTPNTLFRSDRIDLTAVNGTNYNRSYSVLRSPLGVAVDWIEIEFTGIQNSADRAAGGTGSHVYLAVTTVPPLLGDYDANRNIDLADYDVWRSTFGSSTSLAADGNGNGIVDAADFTVWRDAWTLVAVPEPSLSPWLIAAFLMTGMASREGCIFTARCGTVV